MDKEEILAELENRGVNVNSLEPNNQQPDFDREAILEVLKERGIGQTKSGEFLYSTLVIKANLSIPAAQPTPGILTPPNVSDKPS